MTKRELNACPTIGMKFFLEMYYDINEEVSELLSQHSHKSVKHIGKLYGLNFPCLCFDNLSREMVLTGKVVLVLDHYGNVSPYVNPHTCLENEYETDMDEKYTSYEVYNGGEDKNGKYQGRQRIKQIKS